MVEAAQADPACFLDLYDRYFHRVYAYITGRTGNRADAEDVTSEVFTRALANIHSFEWRGVPFGAWLIRVAANQLADRWKRLSREADTSWTVAAASDNDLERRIFLYQLVERLPDTQRRVVELRFGEDRSLIEISITLGKSEGAVKQLQRRALETLRAALRGRS